MTEEQIQRLIDNPPSLRSRIDTFLSWAARDSDPSGPRIREIVVQLVREASALEREACAKLADNFHEGNPGEAGDHTDGWNECAAIIAERIRSRANG